MKLHRWDHIYNKIKDITYPIGAEIGVHRGECSANLLKLHPRLMLYMIDPWSPDSYIGKGDDAAGPESRRVFQEECDENYQAARKAVMSVSKYGRFFRMTSKNAYWKFKNESLDFVFVDGAHDYDSVREDIELWLPKIKKGGYMFGHDIDNPDFPGVRKAVEEMFGSNFEIESDYVWMVRV